MARNKSALRSLPFGSVSAAFPLGDRQHWRCPAVHYRRRPVGGRVPLRSCGLSRAMCSAQHSAQLASDSLSGWRSLVALVEGGGLQSLPPLPRLLFIPGDPSLLRTPFGTNEAPLIGPAAAAVAGAAAAALAAAPDAAAAAAHTRRANCGSALHTAIRGGCGDARQATASLPPSAAPPPRPVRITDSFLFTWLRAWGPCPRGSCCRC